MKNKITSIILCVALTTSTTLLHAQFNILNKVKDKVDNRVDQRTDQGIDKGLNKTEDEIKNGKKKDGTNSNTNNNSTADPSGKNTATGTNAAAASTEIKLYANYDFVPGDKVLFDDNFLSDQDGEFPAHWDLDAGQGIVNKVGGAPAFALTEGNYAKVDPRMKEKSYLTDPFTVEYDYYAKSGGYGLSTFLVTAENEKLINVSNDGTVATGSFTKDFSSPYPGPHSGDTYRDKWHHVAIAYKNKQVKVYVDQYRVLVVPNCDFVPSSVKFGGIASMEDPLVFKNVRVAAGGGMNMLGKKFTEAKIVTHGITFDVNKAVIKPESMGTLNMIVKVMTENPEVKFEVDGHTDSDGDNASNQKLSEARADAVRTQLISMGVDASRLTTKGFGASKPMDTNDSPEGKANNRRVEFVKV